MSDHADRGQRAALWGDRHDVSGVAFYFASRDWAVSPGSPLLVMSLSSNGENGCAPIAQSTLMAHYQWRGFRSYPIGH